MLDDPGLRTFMEQSLGHSLPAWPPKMWDPSMLTLAALYYHQDLALARAGFRVAEAKVVTARQRPNPSIAVAPGWAFNNPPSPWVLSVVPTVPVETAGKRGLRIQGAERSADVARMQLAEVAWQVRARLRLALANLLSVKRSVDLLRAEEQVRARLAELVQQRFDVGEIPRPDLDTALIELANARLAIHTAEGRSAQARIDLASAIGVTVSALENAELSWPGFEHPVPVGSDLAEVQRAAVLNRLDIRRSLAEYAVSEDTLQLEIAKQYPDIDWQPGYNFDAGTNKYTIGVSLTLPVFNRNGGPIAEAEARRKEAEERFLALQAQVIGEAAKALAGYRSALAELAEASNSLKMAQAKEALAKRSFEHGESDRLSLTGSALQTLVAAQAQVSALGRAQVALGALENAVQKPLEPIWLVHGLPTSDQPVCDHLVKERPQ